MGRLEAVYLPVNEQMDCSAASGEFTLAEIYVGFRELRFINKVVLVYSIVAR